MAGELVPIPIQDGIDQGVAIALGQPRVWRLERARLIQPGEVVASPGYANDLPLLMNSATQHLVAVGYSPVAGNWAVVSGNNSTAWVCNIVRRDPVHGWRSFSEWVSPAQAPRRHTILTNATFNSTPQLLPTTDPSLVLVLSNNTWLSYFKNGKIAKEMDFGTADADRTKYYAAGYCFVGARGGVYKYNAITDSFTNPITGGSTAVISVWADPNFGLAGSGIQYCAVVLTTGEIYVYKWDGTSTFSTLGVIPAVDIPAVAPVGAQPGLISCCFVNNLLIRFVGSGPVGTGTQMALYVNEYGLPGLVKQFVSDIGLHSAFGGVPAQSISEIDGAGVGSLWLAFQVYENTTNLVSTNVWTMNVAAPALTIVRPITGRTLTGRLSRAPVEVDTAISQGVIVPCQYGPTSDPASELWSVSASGAQLLTTLHGYQFYWGSTGSQPSPNVYAAMRSALDHKETCSLLIAGQSRLTNTVAPALGTAGVRWANEVVSVELGAIRGDPVTVPSIGVLEPGYQHSPIEAYQQAGDLVSGGLPVSIGNRLDSAGLLFTPPVPTCTAVSGSGLSAGDYLYVALLEVQDSEGRVLRSSPSAPTKVTVGSPNLLVDVVFQVSPLPTISGINANTAQWIIYRTLVNGTVFYRLGAMTANTLADNVSDTDLQVASILYTQGASGGISGIVPSYGVPPCRSIWKGRDRVIAGGLELSRRVRWSKLFYAGEGVAFPHPSSAQWYYDVDDDVTAVAQLDDAWLVFCRTSIYAIYGVGPDDTGANGSFDAPRCISRSFGCHSPRSLLEIPEGVIFQGEDGGIYLLSRGTLQVVWWSEKVRNLLSDINTGLPLGWTTAVIAHESRGTIHFIRDIAPPLIWDKRIQSWSLDTDWVSPGLVGAVTGCNAHIPAATQTLQNSTDENFSVFIGTVDGHLIFEGCNNGANMKMGPDGTVAWNPLLETADVSLFGLMGWGSTPRVSLLFGSGSSAIPCETPATLTIINGVNRGDDDSDVNQVPHEFTDATQIVTSSVAPMSIKSSSIRLRVEWTRESFVGLAIEVDQKPRTERTQASVRA
jgi:hypothetical protein